MSKHHVNCTKPAGEVPIKSKNKRGNQQQQLISKPFCDCDQCLCNDCPDILNMFSITVTENSCEFGSKVTKSKCNNSKKESISQQKSGEIPNLLGTMNDNKDCNCEVATRALRSNIHKSIGVSERKTPAFSLQEPEARINQNSNRKEKK